MIRLNEATAISRPPGEVFAFLADLNNFPKWRANLVAFKILTAGPTDVGTRCEEVVQVGPMPTPAVAMLTRLRGTTHQVYTGIALLRQRAARALHSISLFRRRQEPPARSLRRRAPARLRRCRRSPHHGRRCR